MLYLIEGMPAAAQFLMSSLKLLDVAVALRALRQHDGAMLLAVDMAGRENRRGDAFEGDAVLLREILDGLQLVHRGIDAVTLDVRIASDVA